MQAILSFLVLGSFLACCSAGASKSTNYFCQYFDDGTYSCYTQSRKAKDSENPSTGQRDSYGSVGVGNAIRGPWRTEDGFFKLPSKVNSKAPKKYVGTCSLDKGSGYECSPAAPPCPTPKKNGPPVSCVGPDLFHGMRWSGQVGGRLKAL